MTQKKNQEEVSYAVQRNISQASIQDAIQLIVELSELRRMGKEQLVLNLIGKSGIGKTACVIQSAEIIKQIRELSDDEFQFIYISVGNIGPETVMGIPMFTTDGETWKAVHAEMFTDAFKNFENGLILFDEVNRNADRGILNAMFSWIRNAGVNGMFAPEGWSIVCAMNPSSDGQYMVQPIMDEPAFRRSLLSIEVVANTTEAITYMQSQKDKFHGQVCDYLVQNPSQVFSVDCQNAGKVGPTPASWEKASSVIFAFEHNAKVAKRDTVNTHLLRIALSGVVGTSCANSFMQHYTCDLDGPRLTVTDILFNWDDVKEDALAILNDASIAELTREDLENLDDESTTGDAPLAAKGQIHELLSGLINYLILGNLEKHWEDCGADPGADTLTKDVAVLEKVGKAFAEFSVALPMELFVVLTSRASEAIDTSDDAMYRGSELFNVLSKYPEHEAKTLEYAKVIAG